MHIARVVHIFYGDVMGDPFNTFELSMRQSMFRNNVTLFTWNKEKRVSYEIVNKNFKIYHLKGLNLALKPFFTKYPFLPQLGSMIKREKPELIHAHSHLFLTTHAAITTAKKLGIPSVVTVHGISAERNNAINLLQKTYLHSIGTKIFQLNTITVCLTKNDAKQILRLGCPANKIRIVSNPVDVKLFKPHSKKEQDNLIVWVGRFVPEKGLEYLIDSAKLVQSRVKDVQFLLVGNGPLKHELQYLIKDRGLNNTVFLVGPLEHKEIAGVLAKASIFVFPSLKEGMPKAVLEAMATGTAVVASDIPGMDEIIENGFNGVLVQPRNASALGIAILALLNDTKLRKKLGRNARQTVLKFFTWKNHLNQLERVYEASIERM